MMCRDKKHKKSNLLLTSRDLLSEGGVVSVVSMLLRNFSDNISATHFQIGSRINHKPGPLNLLYPVYDCIRLVSTVSKKSFSAVCLNTSFSKITILRDGLFLTSLSLMGFKDTVVYFHGWDTDFSKKVGESSLLRKCFNFVFLRSKQVIVLATSFKRELIKIGIPAEDIHVVTTMFDAEKFRSHKVIYSVSDNLSLLFLSRFHKEKGAFETIKAFSMLYNLYPQLNLIMAGDGPELEALKKLVDKLGVTGRVHFTGYVRAEKKMEVLKRSDIFVFPTYYREGCPVSLLEAMAAGLAVVTTTVGAIPDIVDPFENGILLRDTNPDTIADAIVSLIGDFEELNQIRKRNRQKAFRKYEAKMVTMKLESILTGRENPI